VKDWVASFQRAGLVPVQHIPILPINNSSIFLLMDSIWHVRRAQGGELGDIIFPALSENANFPHGFRNVLKGLLEMETNWQDCSGAIFSAHKPKD
jgi:hypothetical protein